MSPGPASVQHNLNLQFLSQKNQRYRSLFMIQALFCPEFNQFLYKQLGSKGSFTSFSAYNTIDRCSQIRWGLWGTSITSLQRISNSNMEHSNSTLHLSTLIHNWGACIRIMYVHAHTDTQTAPPPPPKTMFLTRDATGRRSSHPRTCSSGGRLQLLFDVCMLLESILLSFSAVYIFYTSSNVNSEWAKHFHYQ